MIDATIMHFENIIRQGTTNDFSQLVNLESKCFEKSIAYSPKQLHYLITRANSICLVETQLDIIRGFIIVLFRMGSKVAGIETLDVDPAFHGQGIGSRLLSAAENFCSQKDILRIRLEVSCGNHAALRLYEKSSFRRTMLLKDYYQNPHCGTRDAFRMVKQVVT
jgi:ribosomal-protein-alanine N-acetyltransferase